MKIPTVILDKLSFLKSPQRRFVFIVGITLSVLIGIFIVLRTKASPLDFVAVSPTPNYIGSFSDLLNISPNPISHKPCFQNGLSMLEREAPNNAFGMYMVVDTSTIPMEQQMQGISEIVNSNGGDWGYVLIPMYLQNLDIAYWNQFLTLSEKYHLTPIIQLMTDTFDYAVMENQLVQNAQFLGSLSWPTSCRYVSVFNEVNAKDYWGGNIDPEGYAVILNKAIDTYKNANADFFMLNGSFNSSTRTNPWYLSEDTYIQRMQQAQPGVFAKLDGWASHPYPQPGFSGDFHNPPSWYETRDQITNYTWEAQILAQYTGVSNLPIFFTETGWAHIEGNNPQPEYKSSLVTAQYFDDAYRNIWLPDTNVKAIIPFIYYLPGWDNFSWLSIEQKCYAQCDIVKAIPKTAGVNEW